MRYRIYIWLDQSSLIRSSRNNTCRGPWVLHSYQVPTQSIEQHWRRIIFALDFIFGTVILLLYNATTHHGARYPCSACKGTSFLGAHIRVQLWIDTPYALFKPSGWINTRPKFYWWNYILTDSKKKSHMVYFIVRRFLLKEQYCRYLQLEFILTDYFIGKLTWKFIENSIRANVSVWNMMTGALEKLVFT